MIKYVIEKQGVFWPSEEMKKTAWVSDEKIYKEAERNPIKFWEKLAEEGITWEKPWKKAYEEKLPYFCWFKGGKLNFCYNCLDRWLKEKQDKVALIWIPEPLGEKTIKLTYSELYEKVCRFANVLKKHGVKKGDRVAIYLPMIPEAVIAMLACTRLGAIHSVVFSAFSAEALKARIEDAESKILVTADGYYRRGEKENLISKAEEAMKGTTAKKIIVVSRLGEKHEYLDFNKEMEKVKSECKPEIMSSEDIMFILFTSGTTGRPKGIVHGTGGYAVQAYWTTKWDFNLHENDIMWCVPKGKEVISNPAIKKIEDIKIGDKVLTHKGKFEKVEALFCRDYTGDLIKIKTLYDNSPLLLTPNHRVLVLKNKFPRVIEWIEAKDLNIKDFVAFPRIRKNRKKHYVKISDVLKGVKVEDGFALPKKGRKGKIKNKIIIDKDFMRLIGYYIAEGSIAKDTIQLTFSLKEEKFVRDVLELFKEVFGINGYIKEYKGGLEVRVDSIIISKLFDELFGKRSYEKHLPHWMLTLQWNLLEHLIKGYWAGDGSVSKNRRRIRFLTTSRTLAYQIKLILNKMGIVVSLEHIPTDKIMKRQENRKIQSKHDAYELAVTGKTSNKLYNIVGVDKPNIKTTWGRSIVTTNLIFFPVSKKEIINYRGKVYNLKTPSQSYSLNNMVVHNCTADVGWITSHTYGVYGPLLNGCTTLIYEGSPDFPNFERWWKIIQENKISVFYTSPTAIRMFMKAGDEYIKKYNLDSLKILGTVGECIDEDAWMWYFNKVGKGRCPVIDTWWQTETGGTLINSLPGIGPFVPTIAGKSFPGTKHIVVDEKGKEVKKGENGNLVQISPFAPGMLHGVYKNHEKYVETYWEKFKKGKFRYYDTSDGAYLTKDNLIRVTGRTDDVMKVAGHRLASAELENAIASSERINEAAVVPIADKIKGEVPVAFVVLEKNASGEEIEKEIAETVNKKIGPIAKPAKVYVVDDLPKTRSGKIMRRILKNLLAGEEPQGIMTLLNPQAVEKIKSVVAEQVKT